MCKVWPKDSYSEYKQALELKSYGYELFLIGCENLLSIEPEIFLYRDENVIHTYNIGSFIFR